MKKATLLFALAAIICTTSCKKDSAALNSTDKPDSWYQAQLESIVNLHKEAIPGKEVTAVSNVNFATYKEAYETIKGFSTMQTLKNVEPLYNNGLVYATNLGDPGQNSEGYPGLITTYFANCGLSMPVISSLNPGAVGVQFKIQYDIGWNYPLTHAEVARNYDVYPVTVYFSGFGTISNPTNAQSVFISPHIPIHIIMIRTSQHCFNEGRFPTLARPKK